MDWFRWHHGTVTDPKWRVIARRAGVTVRDTLAVWAAVLECASQSPDRGTLDGWDHEDIGAALDMDASQVEAIYAAMQGKVLDGDRVSAWQKRQILREDSTAAERKRLQRDRERQEREQAERDAASRSVTHGHAPDTDTEEIRREEKSSEANASGATAPPVEDADWLFGDGLSWLTGKGEPERNARSLIGRWRKLHGDDSTRRTLEAAMAENPIEPVSWITAAMQQQRGRQRDGPPEQRWAI